MKTQYEITDCDGNDRTLKIIPYPGDAPPIFVYAIGDDNGVYRTENFSDEYPAWTKIAGN